MPAHAFGRSTSTFRDSMSTTGMSRSDFGSSMSTPGMSMSTFGSSMSTQRLSMITHPKNRIIPANSAYFFIIKPLRSGSGFGGVLREKIVNGPLQLLAVFPISFSNQVQYFSISRFSRPSAPLVSTAFTASLSGPFDRPLHRQST